METALEIIERRNKELAFQLEHGARPGLFRDISVEIKEFDDETMTITAYCTTVDVDRYGDIVQPSGMNNKNYRKNPVVLWCHKYDQLPVAKSLWEKPDSKGVRVKIQFDSKREESAEIYRLYQSGYLSGFSIGFIPEQYEVIRGEEDATGYKPITGFNIKQWELLEYSCTPVPANGMALREAFEKGLMKSRSLIKAFSDADSDFKQFLSEKETPKKITLSAEGVVKSADTELLNNLNNKIDFLSETMANLEKSIEDINKSQVVIFELVKDAVDDENAATESKTKTEIKTTPKKVEISGKAFDAKTLIAQIAAGEVSRIKGKV